MECCFCHETLSPNERYNIFPSSLAHTKYSLYYHDTHWRQAISLREELEDYQYFINIGAAGTIGGLLLCIIMTPIWVPIIIIIISTILWAASYLLAKQKSSILYSNLSTTHKMKIPRLVRYILWSFVLILGCKFVWNIDSILIYLISLIK